MTARPRTPAPMTPTDIIDEYFIENRTRLLEIAAYMDRLDRAGGGAGDFRATAMAEAVRLLADPSPGRLMRIQTLLSDPTTEPLTSLDRKSARGAYDRSRGEARP